MSREVQLWISSLSFAPALRVELCPTSKRNHEKSPEIDGQPVSCPNYSAWQGSKIHQEIGRYYIETHGDYFVDVLKYPPNKGFPPGKGGGLGAYNRNIRSGFAFRLYVDLRHYGFTEDYEIKPLTDVGVVTAVLESRAYTAVLNHFESDAGEWTLGEHSYPAWRVWLSPYSSTKTIQTFASPLAPAGAIIYTDNLVRDLSDSKVIKAADRLGYALVKRLQAIAPKMIQDSARAGLIEDQEQIKFHASLGVPL